MNNSWRLEFDPKVLITIRVASLTLKGQKCMITFITWIKIVDFFPLFSYRVECLNNNIVSNIPGFIHHSCFLLAYTLNFHFPLLSIAGIVKPVSTNISVALGYQKCFTLWTECVYIVETMFWKQNIPSLFCLVTVNIKKFVNITNRFR